MNKTHFENNVQMDNLNPPYGVPTTINNEFQTEEVQKNTKSDQSILL